MDLAVCLDYHIIQHPVAYDITAKQYFSFGLGKGDRRGGRRDGNWEGR